MTYSFWLAILSVFSSQGRTLPVKHSIYLFLSCIFFVSQTWADQAQINMPFADYVDAWSSQQSEAVKRLRPRIDAVSEKIETGAADEVWRKTVLLLLDDMERTLSCRAEVLLNMAAEQQQHDCVAAVEKSQTAMKAALEEHKQVFASMELDSELDRNSVALMGGLALGGTLANYSNLATGLLCQMVSSGMQLRAEAYQEEDGFMSPKHDQIDEWVRLSRLEPALPPPELDRVCGVN